MTAPSVPCRERWPMRCYQKWWGRTSRKAGCREPTGSWPALSVHFLPGVQDPYRGCLHPPLPPGSSVPPCSSRPGPATKRWQNTFFKCLNLFANKWCGRPESQADGSALRGKPTVAPEWPPPGARGQCDALFKARGHPPKWRGLQPHLGAITVQIPWTTGSHKSCLGRKPFNSQWKYAKQPPHCKSCFSVLRR